MKLNDMIKYKNNSIDRNNDIKAATKGKMCL